MGIQKKTIISIGMTLIFMIVIIYSIFNKVLLGGYAKIEKQNILQNLEHAMRMIDDELGQLKTVADDWAPWDDTYQFIQDKNQEYIDNNLMDSTMINLHVNFLIYINNAKEIIQCKYLNLETRHSSNCPESIAAYLSSNSFLLRSDSNSKTKTGLAMLPENPILIASASIITSQLKGPVMGTLIVARYINHSEIERLSSKADLAIKLQRLDSAQLPDDFKKAELSLSTKKKVTIAELDNNTISSYALLTDLQDKPILILGIDKERKIFAQGKMSMRYLVFSLLITGLVFIIATLVLLETTVLSRIVRLNKEVKNIGETGNLFSRTSINGKDELADLSTGINQMLESIRINTERNRLILESIEDAYFELDLEGNLIFYNDSLSRIFKFKEEDFKKINYRQLLDEKSAKKAFEMFNQLYETGHPLKSIETEFKLERDKTIFLESTVSLIKDDMGESIGFRGIARDVTERKKFADNLVHMVYHDPLTGLLNRKAFHEHLEKEISYAERYKQERAVLFIDLDKFKKVNDQYGHNAGDQLLVGFANRVEKVLRKTDMMYRLGGDEFAVILTNLQNYNPELVSQRIIHVMTEPFSVDSATIDFVTVSIGVSIYPLNGTDVHTLLQCSDKAMYEAKKTRNNFHIWQTTDTFSDA
ncbi:diguanylate cyclase domain-containing protein [uncultured Desulfobacter sp.]|uniref:diguanylate cyclase domain-containing protein n=1 Tax=uncultured Desulfobacter sp. TaxID=240139 RepID=UPI002AAB7D9B|nr:diguanylate cyclase [uncultured Desulfobacter sp.]